MDDTQNPNPMGGDEQEGSTPEGGAPEAPATDDTQGGEESGAA